MDRWVTPPKKVTSPTWGPTPPCKQALNDQLPFGLLAHLVTKDRARVLEHCTHTAEDRVRILASLTFYRLSLHKCIAYVFNNDDLELKWRKCFWSKTSLENYLQQVYIARLCS